MKESSCIVFDVDGTLFDTKRGIIHALNDVLKHYNKESIAPEQENKYIGPPIKNSLMTYCGMGEDIADVAVDRYRGIYVEKYIQESVPYDGTEQILNFLKDKGGILGIATMKTELQMEALLKIFEYRKYFDIIETAKVTHNLSKTQMLINIKEKYLNVKRFIMVGDTEGDYMAAQKAGYEFIAADYGYGKISERTGIHINSLRELLPVLQIM